MPAILESGTAKIVVSFAHFQSEGFVPIVTTLPPKHEVLLTAHVVLDSDLVDENGEPKLLFTPFRKTLRQDDKGGIRILVCEIDRKKAPRDVTVEVDWALVG